jgi:hypothetical protein
MRKPQKQKPTDLSWRYLNNNGIQDLRHAAFSLNEDVYFTVCAHDKALVNHRGDNLSARLIPGLYADLDCSKPGQTKEYAPRKVMLSFLEGLEHKPSILVDSGGGYHAYWLFEEPIDAQDFPDLCTGYQNHLRAKLEKLGYTIDGTGDLARVLRVPGTIHSGSGKMVKVIELTERRYSADDFTQFIPEKTTPKKKAEVQIDGGVLDMNPDAKLPKKLRPITDDPEFKSIWKRKKTINDTSASGWDYALAQYLSDPTLGLTDQEIANCLIQYRRKRGEPQKLRSDYYERTIKNAKNSLNPFGRKPSLIHGVEPHYRDHTVPLVEAEDLLAKTIKGC